MSYLFKNMPIQAKLTLLRAHLRGISETIIDRVVERPYSATRRAYIKAKRVVSYIPVIWRNEDWDYSHIYDLLSFKLKRVDVALRNGYAEYDPKPIKRTLQLIDYVNNEYSWQQYHSELEANGAGIRVERSKALQASVVPHSVYFNLTDAEIEKLAHMGIAMPTFKHNTAKLSLTGEKAALRARINAKYRNRHARRRRLLFKLISDNIESWWD